MNHLRYWEWKWNGSFEKPTLEPSIRDGKYPVRCISNITEGLIIFATGSSHDLKGMTMEIPNVGDWPK